MAAKAQRRLRADDTRARIFAAAVRLFAEHGYFDTTVDRIVREAGVAKGTFFVHFATKDALVTELVRNQVRAARRTRDKTLAAGGTAVDAMRATVMALGQQAAADRGLSRCVVSANLANPLLGGYAESVFGGVTAEMMDDVRSAQRAGLLTSSVDAATIADSLITVYFGATLHFATGPHSRPLLELLEPVLDANLDGFRAAPAGDPAQTDRIARPPRRARLRDASAPPLNPSTLATTPSAGASSVGARRAKKGATTPATDAKPTPRRTRGHAPKTR